MKSYCLSVSILALALAAGPALAQQSPSDALPPNVRFTQPYPGMPLQNQPFQQNYQNQGPQNQQTVPGGNGGMSLDSTWPIQGPALPVDPTAPISASPPSFGSPAVVPEQAVAPRRPPMEDRDAMARAWSDDASQAARQAGMNLGHGPSRGLAHSTKYSDVQHLAS